MPKARNDPEATLYTSYARCVAVFTVCSAAPGQQALGTPEVYSTVAAKVVDEPEEPAWASLDLTLTLTPIITRI